MSGRRSLGDLNGNGIPDRMEKNHGLSDLNGNGVDDKFERRGGLNRDLNGNGIPDSLERKSFGSSDLNGNGIPDSLERNTWASSDLNGNGIPDKFENLTLGSTFRSEVLLPTKIIEKPAAVHEEIRREQVEEIQPIINVEKLKTEVHQVTQPLYDREVRPVGVSERVLATEILPQVVQPTLGLRAAEDISTVSYKETANIVVEKPAVYMETQKKQIIEEIQPVIYKETIVPTLIKETKPVYQTIVEGTVYTSTVLPPQQLSSSAWASRNLYVSGGLTSDLNGNGIPDSLERRSFTSDLNGNGIPDSLERRSGLSSDWNGNGIPDSLERRQGSGFSSDLNRNGIPDSLERKSFTSDLNGNGIPDKFEHTTTTSTTSNTPYAAI